MLYLNSEKNNLYIHVIHVYKKNLSSFLFLTRNSDAFERIISIYFEGTKMQFKLWKRSEGELILEIYNHWYQERTYKHIHTKKGGVSLLAYAGADQKSMVVAYWSVRFGWKLSTKTTKRRREYLRNLLTIYIYIYIGFILYQRNAQ